MPKLPTMQEIVAYLNEEEKVNMKAASSPNQAQLKTIEQAVANKIVLAKAEEPVIFTKVTVNYTNTIYIDALTKAIIEMDKNETI